MLRNRLPLGAFALATQLYLAAPALAADDGEGLAGETDDKIITFFALGVLVVLHDRGDRRHGHPVAARPAQGRAHGGPQARPRGW